MCGIALVVGPTAGHHVAAFEAMMTAIAPRGEAQETAYAEEALLGTARLKIVDREHAQQPWRSNDGRWTLCYNGEVFNHNDLRGQLAAEGRTFRSHSDTEVVLEAFLAWREEALLRFRGEFAFAMLDNYTSRVFVARDPVGVKPLYWTHRDGHLLIASEVKALAAVGTQIHEVLPGHCGWLGPLETGELHPYIDLLALGEGETEFTDVEEAAEAVRTTLRAAVARRVDTDLRVGVVLSGGLDSSLTLILAKQMHPDVVAFTVGAPGSPDLDYARRLTADLGVPHVVVELSPSDIGAVAVREAVRVAELTEYGDVINAVVSMALFRAVHEAGVKVVLTGDGSDELFGGYQMYRDVEGADTRTLFRQKIRHLSRTELQRVDRTSMGQRVEARVPFLDIEMLRLSMRIPMEFKVRDGVEKWIVREAHKSLLPGYIYARPKNPMSYSSGLHERVRLFRALMPRMYRKFGYEAFEPMRRDFDSTLARANYDLMAAVEASSEDYTVLEHVRDFAGAVKWNVKSAIGA
ncbi:MAG: asparagine synthase (glutamine-hydrolyzing) [Actinobacteria bacterium]|nr:asparagine synthase (glutamine-hydrolyzing) [Actinomycetota bacterium]